jgi:hypothetical protein
MMAELLSFSHRTPPTLSIKRYVPRSLRAMTVPERPRLQSRNLTTELTLMSNDAAGQQVAEKTAHGLTCNLDGIPSQERPRYTELFESLRHVSVINANYRTDTRSSWTRLNLLWIKHSSGPSSNESAVHSSRCKFAGISRTGPCGLI